MPTGTLSFHLVLEEFDSFPAFGTIDIKDIAWLPEFHIRPGAFHLYRLLYPVRNNAPLLPLGQSLGRRLQRDDILKISGFHPGGRGLMPRLRGRSHFGAAKARWNF
jgi:hypothetical protein